MVPVALIVSVLMAMLKPKLVCSVTEETLKQLFDGKLTFDIAF